jgi:hypothetical protein
MSFDNFIVRALDRPTDTIAYSVSRTLTSLFPHRAVVEGSDCEFDVLEFADAGRCSVVGASGLHHQFRVEWRGSGRPLDEHADNAWLEVLWDGHLFDVVYLTWTDEGYRTRFFWIVADSRDVALDFFRTVCAWCSEVHGEVLVFDAGHWSKDDELYAAIRGATFDSLVLPEALAVDLRGDVERFFASRETYERYGVAWKRGLLMAGPPGNGKTHAVKAIVNDAGVPCLYVKSFRSSGDSVQENMCQVFARARRAAPCVLVFEDLDSTVDKKSRSAFLNELDGFASNAGILTLATSNYPEKIDPALVDRPGRFDRKFLFDLPGERERLRFVERWNVSLQPEARASNDALAAVVRDTEGVSFACLKELLVSSATEWFHSGGGRSMDEVLRRRAGT